MGKIFELNSKTKNKQVSPLKSSQIESVDLQSLETPNSKKKFVRRAHPGDVTSSGEPPAKKNRLQTNRISRIASDDDRRKPIVNETGEEDNTRRRRTLKHGELAPPQCTFCKEEQKPQDEPLLECSACKAKYHLKKCLRYKEELGTNIRKSNKWFCPRCVRCSSCERFISDPSNVECSLCCRAWHGLCSPRGHYPSTDFDSAWYCGSCCRTKNFRVFDSPILPQSRPGPKGRKSRTALRDKLEFDGDIEELTDLINKRDFTLELLSFEAGFTSRKPDPLPMANNHNGNNRKSNNEFDYTSKDRKLRIPKVVQKDAELFQETKSEAYPQEPSSSVHNGDQYLHFGTGKSCKAIYPSAYNEPLQSAPHLYACKFCLHTTNLREDLIIHWDYCTVKHPPGNEIYRDDGLSFFEVDGAAQKKYCQDLCLLAKLFIASKTLYEEVETFIFYVLCEITTEGYVIVGYFSKEKNPSKNNNLSCLLVLPMVQKMGYGRLLIDMSYELSRIEHRVGHPEHPLSDLGILAYRGYWRSSLLCYLRKHRKSDRLNIKDICLATRIAPVDIVNQLLVDNIIVFKGGVYTIKLGKRALKYPLSQCRRRFVDPAKLIWRPRPTKEPLDPTKINTYI